MAWYGTVELRALNGKTTTKRWKLQEDGTDGTAFTAAQLLFADIVSALDAITEATLQDQTISYVVEEYNVGLGDITEQALVNVWAEDPANALDVLAISQQYIPAPIVGIFVGSTGSNRDIVDVLDLPLQAYIDALAVGAYISDHEVIDTGAGTNGMENGRRVTRKSG